jgi:hypothetical protein
MLNLGYVTANDSAQRNTLFKNFKIKIENFKI